MNYLETTEFLFSQLPMYQKVGTNAYKANLINIETFCRHLNFPQKQFKSIHIAGTNGKGSVSHMLASVLQTAGYKTGLYTSPHLKDFRERIKINGEMITEYEVVDFVEKNKNIIDIIKPSFFEMTVAMAFEYFAEKKVDIAVIEVGLGGRLDSTNIITPMLSVITNISLDHTQLLGDTIEEIAREKAGIIKANIPVVIGETHPESETVFRTISRVKNADIYFADQEYLSEYSMKDKNENQILNIKAKSKMIFKDLILDLQGIYQRKNVITVLKVIKILQNIFNINNTVIREGLKKVKTNTNFNGRWQILGHNPLIIADTGHNYSGISEVTNQIKTIPYRNLRFIFGTVNDKNIDEILKLLPVEGIYYFTKASIPRALDEQILLDKAEKNGLKGKAYKNTRVAFETAKYQADINDLIFIGGSTFIVSELI
jgi:dihydrofolate synthase/folylpolyglutamate synthase